MLECQPDACSARKFMSQPLANQHDAFFKKVMSEPLLAGTFLREHLPPELVELLILESPELLPGSFVDEALAQHHSDLLFRVPLKSGDQVLAYILLEHKSSQDCGTPLQLLRYIVRILTKWYQENEQLPLPVVVPLVAHQGPAGWTLSTEFIDLFGKVPESLRPYLVSFRHALIDLAQIHDGALSADLRLRAYLQALKYIQRPDLPQHLEVILVPQLSNMDLLTVLQYINRGPVPVSREVLQRALHSLDQRRYEELMGHFSQEFFAEGEAKGHAKGRAEGRAEGEVAGEAKALIRLLEKRFGVVPPHLRERISSADAASIEAWLDRTLEASDMPSIFQPAG
jgi:predicted transposase/invertase (TIGR01784 family)